MAAEKLRGRILAGGQGESAMRRALGFSLAVVKAIGMDQPCYATAHGWSA
jgi:hypothetical protein